MNEGTWAGRIETEIDGLKTAVDDLQKWKNWIVGGAAVIAFFAGLFSHEFSALIKHALQ